MTRKIILASTSPRRKELLTKTGLTFDIVSSNYEEDMTLDFPPEELVIHLSKGKAEDVAKKYQDAIVIGADTIVAHNGKVYGKPHTSEKAKETLKKFTGEKNNIITGFTVIDTKTGRSFSKAVSSTVYFKNYTEKDIDDYVATGEPLDKAGAYAVQGLGKELIEKIEGDYSCILGLPIDDIMKVLKEFNVVKP